MKLHSWKTLTLLAAVLVTLPLLLLPSTHGLYSRTVQNTNNTVASAIALTCTQAVRAAGSSLSLPLTDNTRAAGANDVSVNNLDGSYSANGITYNQPGPCPRDGASGSESVLLNGTNGAVYGPNTLSNPSTLTVQIWFRTPNTTTTGGKLIGYGDSLTGQSGNYDRHIYMANNGRIVFGLYPNEVKVIQSPLAYNDNQWHQATATIAPAGSPNPGMRLYMDGVLVATDTTVNVTQNFQGYIRIGYDNLNSWGPTQPSSFYFKGNLAWASVYLQAITPAQIAATYQAGL